MIATAILNSIPTTNSIPMNVLDSYLCVLPDELTASTSEVHCCTIYKGNAIFTYKQAGLPDALCPFINGTNPPEFTDGKAVQTSTWRLAA